MTRGRILLLGAFAGALMGLTAAYVVAQRVDDIRRQGRKVRLQGAPGDWVKLLMSVISVARQFSRLLTPG